jgi:anti-sigma-K factor RskA
MTEPNPQGISPEENVLAAELALGVLEGDELAAALRHQIAKPEFARAVAIWRDHFAVLALQVPEKAPPADLAQRVAEAVSASSGELVPLAKPSKIWRNAAIASGALAAALAIVLVWQPFAQAPTRNAAPVLVAALAGEDGGKLIFARIDQNRRLHFAGNIAVPQARVAQLWVIAGKNPPRSLGLLQAKADQLALPAGTTPLPLVAGATLAISIEPLGGSPTGLPTGPVVAAGVIQSI